MKTYILALLVMVVGMCATAHAEIIKLNDEEMFLMRHARMLGERFGMGDEMQAILLAESVAGRYGPIGDKHFKDWHKRAYGPMQIRWNTAHHFLRRYFPQYNIDEKALKTLLESDYSFNLWLGSEYLKYLRKHTVTWEQAVLAYNVGLGNVYKHNLSYDPQHYLAKIKDHLANTVRFHSPHIIRHVVKRGDTMSKLAQQYLGNWRKWKDIQRLNPDVVPEKMEIGSVLIIER